MNFNFAAALATLGDNAAFRIANAARPASDYLLNDILPEENRFSYHVDSGSMTVHSTMAGLVGMDSPYPPTGRIEVSTFLENTAKIANHTALPEAALRTLQQMIATIRSGGDGSVDTTQQVVTEALNFLQLVILQPQLDVSEWLRGQALSTGALNWQFNKKGLVVDYGIAAGNKLTNRTGTAHYGGSASNFWADIQSLRRLLRSTGVRAMIAHPDTIDLARYNTVNNMVVTAENAGQITFRRLLPNSREFTADAADTVTLIPYGLEGEVINPAAPDTTLVVPFFPRGKIVAIGNNGRRGYRPGMGSQGTQASIPTRIGYTHMAPTVEAGGRPGRWADMFTPPHEPWAIHGRAASNQLPVIEAPELIAIASTDMA